VGLIWILVAGSNTVGGIDACMLGVLWVVRWKSCRSFVQGSLKKREHVSECDQTLP
jgi:hypothetical protein